MAESGPHDDNGEEDISALARWLDGLSEEQLVALEALVVEALAKSESGSGNDEQESETGFATEDSEGHQATIEESASGFRRFLGRFDFAHTDPDKDPLYIRSRDFAQEIVPKVKTLLLRLHTARDDEERLRLYNQAAADVAAGIIGSSGMPDQEKEEDFSKHPLVRRSHDHARKIVISVAAGIIGTAAVTTAIYKARHSHRGR